jgi:hypothetical protein
VAKLEPVDFTPAIFNINARLDALQTRLKAVERHVTNPAAHQAAHAEMQGLLSSYGLTLPPRDDTYGQFDPADVEAMYTAIRSQPGAQDRDGVCAVHKRTIERLGSLFRHFGWAA